MAVVHSIILIDVRICRANARTSMLSLSNDRSSKVGLTDGVISKLLDPVGKGLVRKRLGARCWYYSAPNITAS